MSNHRTQREFSTQEHIISVLPAEIAGILLLAALAITALAVSALEEP